MAKIQERGSTHVYKVKKIDKNEMDTMVGLCTHDQPAFCNAECPLKLDTKAMIGAAASGDFKKALQIYEKATPFPLVLSQGCEAPCEKKCRMCEVGDGIAIKDIEAAVAAFGEKSMSSGVFRMKKKKTVAIFGQDLFSLFLAGEIEKKMYPLTVYTEAADIENYALSCSGTRDLERIKKLDIDFVFSCCISKEFFEEKRSSHDVVCATDSVLESIFGEYEYSDALMFFPGEKIVTGKCSGVLSAAFGAKKAALSVDRLAQNLSPDNMRSEEGSVESRLYTDLSAAKLLKRVGNSGAYTKEQAIEEAKRCIQCHCDECIKACEFLQKFGKPPVLLAREIYNNTQVIMGDHPLNKIMNACALCGQCKVLCPNGFDMTMVCKNSRENMVATDKMSLAVHEFALLDMYFSNEDAFLARPQPGFDKCKYVFFPGCQAGAVAPETVKAAYSDLCARLDGGVALMLGCCGAICDWAGRYEMYEEVEKFIDSELEKLGNPVIIAGCPSCKKQLKRHNVVGIWDILNEIGVPEGAERLQRPMAMHDSCGARGDSETQNAIRKLARSVGCQLVETEYSGDESPCCGYGGLTAYTDRDLAGRMTEKCLSRSELPYVSYCMACRDRFAREGRESRHVLELVYGTEAGNPPDISEKRYNRLTLKQELLKEIWNEETKTLDLGYEIEYTGEAEKLMDSRMILKSDVLEVIQNYRINGNAIKDLETGHLITTFRSGNVTFWVVFDETEKGYLIQRAYSHRMTVDIREVEI